MHPKWVDCTGCELHLQKSYYWGKKEGLLTEPPGLSEASACTGSPSRPRPTVGGWVARTGTGFPHRSVQALAPAALPLPHIGRQHWRVRDAALCSGTVHCVWLIADRDARAGLVCRTAWVVGWHWAARASHSTRDHARPGGPTVPGAAHRAPWAAPLFEGPRVQDWAPPCRPTAQPSSAGIPPRL